MALANVGSNRLAKMPMMAMTTNNSMSVNARVCFIFFFVYSSS